MTLEELIARPSVDMSDELLWATFDSEGYMQAVLSEHEIPPITPIEPLSRAMNQLWHDIEGGILILGRVALGMIPFRDRR